MAIVTCVDETTAGARTEACSLDFPEERLTVREVIRRRVFQDVAEYNARRSEPFRGLVAPGDAEPARCPGRAAPGGRRLDPEAQAAAAVTAFGRGRFLVLVGERQVEQLDEEVEFRFGTEITFLKLVALVGG